MSNSSLKNSFNCLSKIKLNSGEINLYRLDGLSKAGVADVSNLPFTIKILIEQALRTENGKEVTREHIAQLAKYDPKSVTAGEIPFKPARVLMQDFTGVPAVVDLAALRSAMAALGKDPNKINPQLPVDLVIDHSVQVDEFGTTDAADINTRLEFERNNERYEFLHWGQKTFDNFRVVPPASGICHQINLEFLGRVVHQRRIDGEFFAFPDTVVGTDSHTTMINGMGILGWGVGGIEAEAAMLGQPIYMLIPEVVGFKLTGRLNPKTTATDLVLKVTQILRGQGVVGKFVEFFGSALSTLSLPDRATVSNMSPEYGATCGFFPVDEETLNYLRYTGRSVEQTDLIERYCKEQGLFFTTDQSDKQYGQVLELDISSVEPALAGPKRPFDLIRLFDMKPAWEKTLKAPLDQNGFAQDEKQAGKSVSVKYSDGTSGKLKHGDVVIAAITSCTNTSNPSVLIGAGILAKKATEAGLSIKKHVKTSLSPGSKVVTEYLDASELTHYLDKLGFNMVGYGCGTCIGNSGPLPENIVTAVQEEDLVLAGVLSGNRNFEGRINPHVKANYLASPILVVAYALAGSVHFDFEKEPLGTNPQGDPVFLDDLWPTSSEIQKFMHNATNSETFKRVYSNILFGNEIWNAIPSTDEPLFQWKLESTYIQLPPFFIDMKEDARKIEPIQNARALVMVENSVTTDHISPAGAISADSPAGQYLMDKGVNQKDFNSYGSRRGNDRIMMRGTFANIRLKNKLAPGTEGGWTTYLPNGKVISIFEASRLYKESGTPVIVIAGSDYGMGSSRDWAAKGTFLLGIKAVIAQSFERIHRSNLVGMGVLPLQFKKGEDAQSLGLTGQETFSIKIDETLKPGSLVEMVATDYKGKSKIIYLTCRIDTPIEIKYYRNGGILHTVLRNMMNG